MTFFTTYLTRCCPKGVVTAVVPRTSGRLSTVLEVRLADANPLIVKQYAGEWRWKQAKEVHVYPLSSMSRTPLPPTRSRRWRNPAGR
jgi:hypothetical protein